MYIHTPDQNNRYAGSRPWSLLVIEVNGKRKVEIIRGGIPLSNARQFFFVTKYFSFIGDGLNGARVHRPLFPQKPRDGPHDSNLARFYTQIYNIV